MIANTFSLGGQLALRTMLCVPLQLIAPLTTALQRPVRRVGDFKSILGLDVKSQITAEIQRSWAQVVSQPTSATRSLPKMTVFYSLLVNNRRCRQLSRWPCVRCCVLAVAHSIVRRARGQHGVAAMLPQNLFLSALKTQKCRI